MKTYHYGRNFVVAFALVLLAGCATSPVEGPFYYLLSAQSEQSSAIELDAFKVGLGPVDLPTYLERDGILTFSDNNQLNYSESHRWAEPLQENVLQVLQANMIRLLPNQQVVYFPWRQLDKPRYQVMVNFTQFALHAEQRVELAATWTLNDSGGEQLLVRNASFSLPITDTDYSSIVKAQSMLLSKLSAKIAQAVADESSS